MTQDEHSTIDEVARVLRDATRDYTGHRTIGEWAKLAAKTIERLRAELAKAKEAIACLEAANAEFVRIMAESRTVANYNRDDPSQSPP